jgi:hypothetical protein
MTLCSNSSNAMTHPSPSRNILLLELRRGDVRLGCHA